MNSSEWNVVENVSICKAICEVEFLKTEFLWVMAQTGSNIFWNQFNLPLGAPQFLPPLVVRWKKPPNSDREELCCTTNGELKSLAWFLAILEWFGVEKEKSVT